VITVWRGHIDGRVVNEVIMQHRELSRGRDWPRYWLVDAMATTGYSADVRETGRLLLQQFREHGGVLVTVATELVFVRVLAAGLAMATRLPIKLFGSLPEAMNCIDAHRGASSPPR
jgi:hypothetical protein